MPRLPVSGMKMKKVKVGTTVQVQTADEIEFLRNVKSDSIRTPGEAIDFVFKLIMRLDPEVARSLDKTCVQGISSIDDELSRLRHDGYEKMAVASKRLQQEQFSALHEHLSNLYEDDEVAMGMRRVDLLGDDFAVFPSDWVLLEPESAAKACSQVSVIEIHGGAEYCAPHFVFFHNGEYDKNDKLEKATELWPQMKDVRRDEVKLVADDNGKYLNMKEHLAAPIICYFNLLDASYYQSVEMTPPYNAVINRIR